MIPPRTCAGVVYSLLYAGRPRVIAAGVGLRARTQAARESEKSHKAMQPKRAGFDFSCCRPCTRLTHRLAFSPIANTTPRVPQKAGRLFAIPMEVCVDEKPVRREAARSRWLEVVPQRHFQHPAAEFLVRNPVGPATTLRGKNTSCVTQVEIVGVVLIKRLQRMIQKVEAREPDLYVLAFGKSNGPSQRQVSRSAHIRHLVRALPTQLRKNLILT